MKVNRLQVAYHYKGFWGCDCVCDLEIRKAGDRVTVILTERDDNEGTSITNMYEQLATVIYYQYLSSVQVENITWIEHYPKTSFGETWDKVNMRWDGKQFSSPKWKRIREEDTYE